MALAGTTLWECQTGGSDANNGGAFDPGQTAGMFTDGAATSATGNSPVFSSASYNFVAGDVGAWVFVGAGTNWTKGWYQIASVASNVATLSAAIGAAELYPAQGGWGPSTAAGCATTASPTGATWSIDYSRGTTANVTYTDLASVGAGLAVSSVAFPFAKQQVGNCIVITGGTNFTAGRYVIASVAATVATVLGAGNITTGAGVSGTGGLGGCLVSAALATASKVASNCVFIRSGTYSITSASTNVAVGCISDALGGAFITYEGYGTVRGDLGTAPVIQANVASATLFNYTGASSGASTIRNMVFDGNSQTGSIGLISTRRDLLCYQCTFKRCVAAGVNVGGAWAVSLVRCLISANTVAFVNSGNGMTIVDCVSTGNSSAGFTTTNASLIAKRCLSYANTGAFSDGFTFGANNPVTQISNCVAYGNGRDGFRLAGNNAYIENCIAEGNSAYGFSGAGTVRGSSLLSNCAGYNNTSGNVETTTLLQRIGFVTLTGSPFTNAGSGDFSLNTTAGAGAACRAAAYPGVFPGATTTGYLDIGAAQHADPAASGGESVAIFGG